jgi:DNA-binding HxlR family transcriptional regulator
MYIYNQSFRTIRYQSICLTMKKVKEITSRSDCPISYTLDFVGDKWTLLILRDMMFAGKSAYGDFLQSDEKVATNILADRLNMLVLNGFITKTASAENKAKFVYNLTEKGISLLPVVIEMSIWGSKNNPFATNTELLSLLKKDKEKTIREFTKLLKKKIA